MGWLNDFRKRRIRRRFKQLGDACVFSGVNYDLKGRVEAGAGCLFGGNLVLRTHKGGHIRFGNNVEVSDYVLVQVNAGLDVGNDTYIGPYTVLRDTNHFFQGSDMHWRLMPHITEPIVVGKGCYIGPGCYIMPGVNIGDGAVIAPMSVVHCPTTSSTTTICGSSVASSVATFPAAQTAGLSISAASQKKVIGMALA